jgi:large subunit ribosomal protein L1
MSPKYELAVKLKALRNSPGIRSRIRLPHPVKTDLRICVFCEPNTPQAAAALRAGASLVGDDEVISAVQDGRIDFDRCICHADSLQKLNKSGIARILGPHGLMPSAKTGTVVTDVEASLRSLVGASEYRERLGVIRLAIAQVGFTPEEIAKNLSAFMEQLNNDIKNISEKTEKGIHEVVGIPLLLSSCFINANAAQRS